MTFHEVLLRNLQQWGLMDFILPVLLIFTTVFGILQKIAIFKDEKDEKKPNKKVNLILGLGIALAATIPHFTGQGPDVVLIISNLLPNSFVIVFALMLCLLLLSLVSPKMTAKDNITAALLAFLAFAMLLVVILQAGGLITVPFLNFVLEPNTLAILIIILVFALVIWYVTKKPESELIAEEKEPLAGLGKFLKKMFGE